MGGHKMKVLGLFSGVGGFELGMQRAGFTISKMCEIEKHCIRVLEKNFPNVEIENDVKNLVLHNGDFDVFTGGFPCQDISIAGKNKGLLTGNKSSLWREYLRVITDGRPKYAIIENVSALLGRGLEIVLQDLAQVGYDATYTTFDSKYFGVPQRRRRVYILAVRDGIPTDTDIFQFGERDSITHQREIDYINQSFKWNFTARQNGETPFAYYTRQRSDEFACTGLSSTLMKRDYKDFTDLVLSEHGLRKVSVKERLRLQSYPDSWFDGVKLTMTQAYSCNGMTVNVVEHIGRLLMQFDLQQTQGIKP